MNAKLWNKRRRFAVSVVFLIVLSMVAAACGGAGDGGEGAGGEDTGTEGAQGGDTGTEAAGGGGGEEAQDADGVIRMVLAPDPVWDWLTDQGIREEMEQEAEMQILDSATWDEFGVYAGGHADVVSAAAYEVPELEEATGIETTVFGKYNADRSVLAVRAEDTEKYQSICDLEGQTVVSLSAVSITIMWGIYAQEECGLDLNAEGGDFDLVVTDIQNMAGLVERGDAEACLCLPDFSIKQLREEKLVPLNDGRSAAQIFADEYGDGHNGPQTNVFLAPTAWVEKNPEEAAFLISVWDRGLEEWRENRDQIIETYPQHFAAESDEEIQFIKDWLENTYDWFEETAYIDEEWIEGENQIFDLMKETGYLPEDAENPTYNTLEDQQ
ncbi:MAG: ABC transporter substrate-binding protein [Nitriliruptorales bacterium]|nr:ABC transporter substrate-binding protein [Nitriliruptorales bacterium]